MISMRPAASTGGGLSPGGRVYRCGSAPEWRNWHTRWISKAIVLRDMSGSTPASGIGPYRTNLNPCAGATRSPTPTRAAAGAVRHPRVGRGRRRRRATTSRPPIRCSRCAGREDGARDLGPAALGPGAGPLGREGGGTAADQRSRRDADEPAGVPRVVSRAPLPDPRRRLLRVADRRARQAAGVVQPSRRRAVRVRRASGPSCRARGRRRPAQLRDRHLRAE